MSIQVRELLASGFGELRYEPTAKRIRAVHELIPSGALTWCAYQGQASYFSVSVGGRLLPDIAWSYTDPRHDAVQVRDLIAFFDERIDVSLDGERRARPVTSWS